MFGNWLLQPKAAAATVVIEKATATAVVQQKGTTPEAPFGRW